MRQVFFPWMLMRKLSWPFTMNFTDFQGTQQKSHFLEFHAQNFHIFCKTWIRIRRVHYAQTLYCQEQDALFCELHYGGRKCQFDINSDPIFVLCLQFFSCQQKNNVLNVFSYLDTFCVKNCNTVALFLFCLSWRLHSRILELFFGSFTL